MSVRGGSLKIAAGRHQGGKTQRGEISSHSGSENDEEYLFVRNTDDWE